MIISPVAPRDFAEMVNGYFGKEETSLKKMEDIRSNSDAINYIIKSMLELHMANYEQMCKTSTLDSNIVFFYKMLVCDYYDFSKANQVFCGLQKYSLIRSMCEHARMFLLCLCDEDFKNYYFQQYTQDEKKDRFYKKRDSKVGEKLRLIAEEAKSHNTEEMFDTKSTIFNLTTELYTQLSDEVGQLSHLSEITLARNLFSQEKELSFDCNTNEKALKFDDLIIEYLVYTTLAAFVIFYSEKSECCTPNTIEQYNFLNYIGDRLFVYRNTDRLLTALKDKVKEIYCEKE